MLYDFGVASIWVIVQARYEILRSCLGELQRVQIVSTASQLPPAFTDLMPTFMTSKAGMLEEDQTSRRENGFGHAQLSGESLRRVADACEVGLYLL